MVPLRPDEGTLPQVPAGGMLPALQDLRVALVHDWLTGMRGGEKVLEALVSLFPQAELFSLVYVPGSISARLEARRPRTTWLSALPAVRRIYRHLLPLFPTVVETLDLDRFDLIVSSSHCAVKSVIKGNRARHLCYCHTPMRYVWDQFDAYFGVERLGRFRSQVARSVMRALRRWDADTAGRVDRYIANSRHVAHRISRYYNRRASVIYPPVDTDFFRPDGTRADGTALVVSSLVPYKRVDLAIKACHLAGVGLRIAGDGPERSRLARLAGPDVEFLGALSDEGIRESYRRCSVLLLPGEEDFGIVPVEAQACGRPVVALGRGGATETVLDGETGVLVPDGTAEALAAGLRRAFDLSFDAGRIRRHAEQFGQARFVAEIAQAVQDLVTAPPEAVRW